MAGREFVFQTNKKYDMVQCLNQCYENVEETLELYFHRYPERHQPSRATIFRLKNNLLSFGACSKPGSKVYNKENREMNEINVLASVHTYPQSSCAKLENYTGVSQSRVHMCYMTYCINLISETNSSKKI